MLLDRINAALLSALLVLAPIEAEASQGALFSPTTGTISGLQLTNNYNNALDALNTCNSGATAPVNQLSGSPSLGNCWLNSTASPFPWQTYDGTSWLTPFWVDASNHVTNVKIGGGAATAASSATVDLCGAAIAPQAYISITGTTNITSFGSTCKAGHVKIVTFTASLTLTYNATSLIIPGATNVVTTAGDQAVVVALGSGNWQVVSYTPANGQALINPAIDVGAIEWTFSPNIPSAKYLWSYGQAVARATYPAALAALTITQSVTATSGSPTLTGFSDTTQIVAQAAVEATFLPNGTIIVSCTSTTCTLNNNATTSTTGNVTIFPYGNGCGYGGSCASPSTSFNLPDCRDVAMVGRGNMGGSTRTDSYQLTSTYFGASFSPNSLGAFGGGQSQQLGAGNIPTINSNAFNNILAVVAAGGQNVPISNAGVLNAGYPGGSGQNIPFSNSGSWSSVTSMSGTTSNNINVVSNNTSGSTTGNAFSRVPPEITANCMIRVLAMAGPSRQLAANDNAIDPRAIIDRRRRAA
jgi:hypothetical protein